MQEEVEYYPPTRQNYQYKVLIYQANGLEGHRLVEHFRNDHLIEVNPNIILGTIRNDQKYSNELGLDHIIDVHNQLLLNSAIATSDIILFPLRPHNTQQLQHLLKLSKCLDLTQKKKIIVISPIFSWRTRNHKKEIKTEDYPTRLPNHSAFQELENLCLGLNHFNQHLHGCVLNSGLVYGMGEDTLFYQFKQALEQKAPLKIYGRGINHIPTIHVDDLAQLAFDIAFSNTDGLHFAVDHSRVKQRELIEAISQTIGNGNVEQSPIEDGFLQENFDIFASDIVIDKQSLPKISTWKYKEGLIANMGAIVGEFNTSRGLKPNKIFIHGTPASGKSKLAQTLSKNYGLPVLTIKQLIEDIKNQDSPFANQIKGRLQELKALKIEEERKIYEQAKKKKKGKGMEDFDPSKVVPRLEDKDVCRVVKRRINMADCLNKGYIIDGVLKSHAQCSMVFNNDNGQPVQAILPNSVFSLQAAEQQTKERIKKLPAQITEGTHWNEQHTTRRFNTYKQHNQGQKWSTYFQNKVDIKNVPFNYTDPNQFVNFIERNGPLGFKAKPNEKEEPAEVKNEEKEATEQKQQAEGQEERSEEEENGFDLDKLTQNQTKIFNEKSRPIRQYLIDNVIPQITEGLLQICKQTPPDPINYLINFLQTKKTRKRKAVKI